MRDRDIKKSSFRSARFIFYIILFVNGFFIQYFAPFQYKCNYDDKKCFACGLRTAINLVLQGNYKEAFYENKLIILIIIICAFMLMDICFYTFNKKKSKK